jgi:hypothetical protein
MMKVIYRQFFTVVYSALKGHNMLCRQDGKKSVKENICFEVLLTCLINFPECCNL